MHTYIHTCTHTHSEHKEAEEWAFNSAPITSSAGSSTWWGVQRGGHSPEQLTSAGWTCTLPVPVVGPSTAAGFAVRGVPTLSAHAEVRGVVIGHGSAYDAQLDTRSVRGAVGVSKSRDVAESFFNAGLEAPSTQDTTKTQTQTQTTVETNNKLRDQKGMMPHRDLQKRGFDDRHAHEDVTVDKGHDERAVLMDRLPHNEVASGGARVTAEITTLSLASRDAHGAVSEALPAKSSALLSVFPREIGVQDGNSDGLGPKKMKAGGRAHVDDGHMHTRQVTGASADIVHSASLYSAVPDTVHTASAYSAHIVTPVERVAVRTPMTKPGERASESPLSITHESERNLAAHWC
jgi:hypothetical protein